MNFQIVGFTFNKSDFVPFNRYKIMPIFKKDCGAFVDVRQLAILEIIDSNFNGSVQIFFIKRLYEVGIWFCYLSPLYGFLVTVGGKKDDGQRTIFPGIHRHIYTILLSTK